MGKKITEGLKTQTNILVFHSFCQPIFPVFKISHRCDPKAVCFLTGTGAGKTYAFSTKDQVDDEGGIVETKMNFILTSDSSASGTYTSKYVHPSGFTMKWGADIRLSR